MSVIHFPLKIANPLLLGSRDTRTLGGVDLGLPQRRSDAAPTPTFGPIAWQATDTDRYSLR